MHPQTLDLLRFCVICNSQAHIWNLVPNSTMPSRGLVGETGTSHAAAKLICMTGAPAAALVKGVT